MSLRRLLLFTFLLMATMMTKGRAATPDTRCFEMRVYFAAEGKLEELQTRFRKHTVALFAKHGMTNLGYWVPLENPENKLIYVLAYPSREARDEAWKAFEADPDWLVAKGASEQNGKLVAKVESTFLQATDFSPEIRVSAGTSPRTFELRTYTTTPGNLERLLKRFRGHTVGLFVKHGMTNVAYWTLQPGQPGAENTLVYILAHASKAAGEASFKAFRADPTWVAAKAASEQEAGGSLTTDPDGVKSVFMAPTDFSPTR